MNAVPAKVIDALHARPGDDAALVAFADELSQAGDLRGELAVLVAQRKLQPMTRFLLANAAKLFGAAEPFVHDGVIDELAWAPGFLRQATIVASDVPMAEVTTKLLASPVGCLVRALHFANFGEDDSSADVLAALKSHPAPRLLDTLVFDGLIDEFAPLWAAAPAVRHLAVRGIAEDLARFPAARLEALSWLDTSLSAASSKTLQKLKFPDLVRLELGALDDGEEGEVDQGGLLAFVLNAQAPHLAHLSLVQWHFDEDDLGALFECEAFGKLETLDLGSCTFETEALTTLFDAESNFADLKVCLPGELADELGDEYQASVWPGLVPGR